MDGKTLTFERAGLRGSNFFMQDKETGSHWQQLTGESFEGPLKGKRLAMVDFVFTTWEEWRRLHPDTLVIVPEPAYKDNYAVMAHRIGALPLGSRQTPDRELLRKDDRLPAYEPIMGVEIGGAHKAYVLSALSKHPVLNDEVGRAPVLVVYSAANDTTTIFSRRLHGRTLEFHALTDVTREMLADKQTGSKWTTYGECTAGKLKGQKLDAILPLPSLWFSWAEFYPDTQVYSGAVN